MDPDALSRLNEMLDNEQELREVHGKAHALQPVLT